jgi:type 1 glutamine amidotransferase
MKRTVLLVTGGLWHPPLAGRAALFQALGALDGFTFGRLRSLEQLPAGLEQVAALVLYYHHKRLSSRALGALEAFVGNGGGVLAVHSATASFKDARRYFEVLGGRFTGHGKVASIRIEPVVGKDAPFGGIEAFTVTDELYLHDLQPGIRVHFSAAGPGGAVPVVWTHRFGAGRVCYCGPGHRAASMRHPVYQEILRRGLLWAAAGTSGHE